MVVRRAEQLEAVIGVLDHVVAIAAPENVGVAALDAGQIIVAGSAIEGVVVDQPVDRIVAGRARIGEHSLDDIGEVELGTVIENELLDEVRRDVVEPVAAPEDRAEQSEVEADSTELAL